MPTPSWISNFFICGRDTIPAATEKPSYASTSRDFNPATPSNSCISSNSGSSSVNNEKTRRSMLKRQRTMARRRKTTCKRNKLPDPSDVQPVYDAQFHFMLHWDLVDPTERVQYNDTQVRTHIQKNPGCVKAKYEFGSGRGCHRRFPLYRAVALGGSVKTIQMMIALCPEALEEGGPKRHLPLHVACAYQSPYDVIRLLFDHYPEAVYKTNKNGFLPLHNAVEYLYWEPKTLSNSQSPPTTSTRDRMVPVIKLLVDAYPEAVYRKNKLGNTPYKVIQDRISNGIQVDRRIVELMEKVPPPSPSALLHDKRVLEYQPSSMALTQASFIRPERDITAADSTTCKDDDDNHNDNENGVKDKDSRKRLLTTTLTATTIASSITGCSDFPSSEFMAMTSEDVPQHQP